MYFYGVCTWYCFYMFFSYVRHFKLMFYYLRCFFVFLFFSTICFYMITSALMASATYGLILTRWSYVMYSLMVGVVVASVTDAMYAIVISRSPHVQPSFCFGKCCVTYFHVCCFSFPPMLLSSSSHSHFLITFKIDLCVVLYLCKKL